MAPGRLARWRDAWSRFRGRGAYPPEFALLLEIPLRGLLLSPRGLAARLGLAPDARVLELGPGPGYFSREIARRLPRGRLELCDLQPAMLRRARRKLERAGISRASFTAADATALPYRSGVFDAAFLVAVLGEVPDPRACLRELARVLRRGGRLSISELPGDPDRLSPSELAELAGSAGFRAARAFAGRAYTANFEREGGG